MGPTSSFLAQTRSVRGDKPELVVSSIASCQTECTTCPCITTPRPGTTWSSKRINLWIATTTSAYLCTRIRRVGHSSSRAGLAPMSVLFRLALARVGFSAASTPKRGAAASLICIAQRRRPSANKKVNQRPPPRRPVIRAQSNQATPRRTIRVCLQPRSLASFYLATTLLRLQGLLSSSAPRFSRLINPSSKLSSITMGNRSIC